VINYISYFSKPEHMNISPKSYEYLEKGFMYTAGRDKEFRPTINVRIDCLKELEEKKVNFFHYSKIKNFLKK